MPDRSDWIWNDPFKIWEPKEVIPCPFMYSRGRNRKPKPCPGHVTRIWQKHFPDGGVSHYHVVCSYMEVHGSPKPAKEKFPGDPSDDPLKFWFGGLPLEIQKIVDPS